MRWLETHQHAQEIAQTLPDTHFVCVADSEADIFEVIECDEDSPDNFRWIIRNCYDRKLVNDDPEAPKHLHEQLLQSPVLYNKQIFIRGRDKKVACDKRARNQPRVSRECTVEVRATTVTLNDPYRSDRKLKPTTVNTEDEWQPVYKVVTNQDPPATPPTLREMVRLIARLGGFIDRSRHDEPGTDTVMRGMERLHDISTCWSLFGPKSKVTRC